VSMPWMMFLINRPDKGIAVENAFEPVLVMFPFAVSFVPGSKVYPIAVSKLLTEANPCAVGQTAHIRWAITGASLGSLLFMMSSKPLKSCPVHSALVTLPAVSV
jgi:hypothetical protein